MNQSATTKRPIRILSLGAGVQSSTVLLKSCRGELPKLDHAIFADTQWEPRAVYDHLEWLKAESESAGIPVHIVTAGNLRNTVLESQVNGNKSGENHFASIPLHTLSIGGQPGMIRRQCTKGYKIEPIEKFIKAEILKIRPYARWPKDHRVDHWFGISSDEPLRARCPIKVWEENVYPLMDLRWANGTGAQDWGVTKPMSRQDCINWLEANYPERSVPRSACIGCPFHSHAEWRAIKDNEDEWRDAVEMDRAVRKMHGMDGAAFLHRSLKPLEDVDLRTDEEQGQMTMWNNECEGMCGV